MADKSEFRKRIERYEGTLIIGVAGDSGSGKTTFTRAVRRLLGPEIVSMLTLDSYHTEDRKTRKETGHLPLDPKINDLELAAGHVAALRKGESIMKPNYNHSTGEFDPPTEFRPTKIVIVEGLHTFFTTELRKNIDMSIYVDPQREVKWDWKIRRDVDQRDHDKEEVIKEILLREPLYKKYIDVQKIYADVIIKIYKSGFHNPDGEVYSVRFIQRLTDMSLSNIDLNLDMSSIINSPRKPFSIRYRSDYYYGQEVAEFTMDGLLHHYIVDELEERVREYTGFPDNLLFDKGEEYINTIQFSQLLVCWRFVETMDCILKEVESANRRLKEQADHEIKASLNRKGDE